MPYPQGICLLCTLCSGLQMLFSISVAVPYFLYVLKTQPYANDGDDTYTTLLETVKIAQFSACLALSLRSAVLFVWREDTVIALAYFLMWGVLGIAVLVAVSLCEDIDAGCVAADCEGPRGHAHGCCAQ